jgi:hypothetical protein
MRSIIYVNNADVAVELLRESLSDEGSFPLRENILSLKKCEESSAPSSVLFFTQHEKHEDEVDLNENEDIIKYIGLDIIGTWVMKFSGEDNKIATIQVAAKKEPDMQEMRESESCFSHLCTFIPVPYGNHLSSVRGCYCPGNH